MRHPGVVIRVLIAFLVGIGGGAACHPEDPHCHGDVCDCRDHDVCDFECDVDGCDADCGNSTTCDGICHDDCLFRCHDSSSCYATCDAGCRTTCERVSDCDVDCGEDCEVTCRDLSQCSVRMVSGHVTCERVSGCDVQCIDGDTLVDAQDCGDGHFACGPC